MVILVDDLDDVSHSEANACFFAGDEVVFGWIILKLRPDIDLKRKRQSGPHDSVYGLKMEPKTGDYKERIREREIWSQYERAQVILMVPTMLCGSCML